MARCLKNMIKCENRLKYLNNQYRIVNEPKRELVNIKTKGFLTYSNWSLFIILRDFELCFMKKKIYMLI